MVGSPPQEEALEVPRRASIEVVGPPGDSVSKILNEDALAFLSDLQRRFGPLRNTLLREREEAQVRYDAGEFPAFPEETADQRAAEWTVAPIPHDLRDRRVEITGPVDRKMVINALNSGASTYMADFEDSTAPTWANVIDGQVNLYDAVRHRIDYEHPETGKAYKLNEKVATLIVRPRGWHLPERHVLVDGEPMSASLFDFGLYFFHNARELLTRGTGPYFYLPKLQGRHEARLWNDVFLAAQEALNIPSGTVRATVLIETLPAAFEMDEILFELREHSAGLNCGRWDYIFSFIKTLRAHADHVMPDRGSVGMDRHFLHSYSLELIRTCHRRGAHAMGGMAAQIPIKDDVGAGRAALEKVAADKRREAGDGHDGTWVAHPGLVGLARDIFDELMPGPNQISRLREDVSVTAEDLLTVPEGAITAAGLRQNVDVGVRYLASWLGGTGCVPLYHLMEDAATAEISRTQVWQWIRHGAQLDDGRLVDVDLYRHVQAEVLADLRERMGDAAYQASHVERAAALFDAMITAPELPDFLTLPAYAQLVSDTAGHARR
ncbi:MAG: malate synthase A [Planctomycetota bacterium]|jgi:malate synthase